MTFIKLITLGLFLGFLVVIVIEELPKAKGFWKKFEVVRCTVWSLIIIAAVSAKSFEVIS
jgi:hypothetical protein